MQKNGKGARRHLPPGRKFEEEKEVIMGMLPVFEVRKKQGKYGAVLQMAPVIYGWRS